MLLQMDVIHQCVVEGSMCNDEKQNEEDDVDDVYECVFIRSLLMGTSFIQCRNLRESIVL